MNRSPDLHPIHAIAEMSSVEATSGAHIYSYSDSQAGSAGTSVKDLWYVLKKRKGLIAFVFSLSFGAVVFFTFMATPIYTAETQLLIERRTPRVMDVEAVLAESLGTDEATYYKTQHQILQSPGLATRVILDEGLTMEQIVPPSLIGEVISRLIALIPTDSRPLTTSAPVDPRLIAAYLSEGLIVEPVRSSRIVMLRFSSPDPQISARVVNAHAQAYIEQGLKMRTHASQQARDFLERNLAGLKERLEQSERDLNDYRRARGIISLDDKENITVERLGDLTAQFTEAEAQREALEAQVELIGERSYESLPAVIENQLIWKLKEELAVIEGERAAEATRGTSLSDTMWPEHSRMAQLNAQSSELGKRIDREIERIVDGIESAYLASKLREESTLVRLELQKEDALQLKDDAVRYAVLERETRTNQQLHDTVLERTKEMSMAAEMQASNIFVLHEAFPPIKPSSPRKGLNLALGLFFGLFGGIGLAFGFESLGSTFKTPEEVEQHLRLPTLGVIPDAQRVAGPRAARLPWASKKKKSANKAVNSEIVAIRDPMSVSTEAYRAIRTALLFSRAGEPPGTLLFTSSKAGEGKTVTALNMAAVFSQLGGRVLLVDADLRRTRCRTVLDVDPGPGLTEAITGQVPVFSSIRATGHAFDFLGTGDLPPNPTELLGSRTMQDVLRELGKAYNYVIIDTPPLGPVSDALVMSPLVDGVVLVVDHQTPRQMVQRARSQLASAGARVLGVVMNRADPGSPGYAAYLQDGYV